MSPNRAADRSADDEASLTSTGFLLAEIYGAASRLDDALDEVVAGLETVESTNQRFREAGKLRLRGMCMLARDGDASAAKTGFRRALDIARSPAGRCSWPTARPGSHTPGRT